ncbi:YwmB family TATA-box binding protein [Paenibacillus pini]|uniref:TATA-box binding protein n=1 Tax=Paenibacillus pini JCM 16418 TaxID=1236976 RepID=W7YA73_9BACL|nr:YwmB family TATA-box binding protein [Paenibacillus pini]GAF07945.1 hypothetical protein JCM16418_1979 [Paenibacillus pini JCM 16418]
MMQVRSLLKKYMIMAIIIIVIFGAGVWTNHLKAEAVKASGGELQTLITMGHRAAEGTIRVISKWQGTWNVDPKFEGNAFPLDAAKQLARRLQLPEVQQIEESGHIAYRVLDERNEVNIRFNWEEISSTQSYVIVQFETENKDSLGFMEQIQDEAGQQMKDFGIDAVWNGAVQGTVKGEGKVQDVMKLAESKLLTSLSAVRAETYEDVSTISNSYEVPSLAARINSEGRWLNMQMAVHKISGSENTRITIGLPVITIEY